MDQGASLSAFDFAASPLGGVLAEDMADLGELKALCMRAARALTVEIEEQAPSDREAAEKTTVALGRVVLMVQRTMALRLKFVVAARRDEREARGVGGSGGRRRAPNHPRKPRARELVAGAIERYTTDAMKRARLTQAMDTRLDCLDVGAELIDRPLPVIAMDLCHGLNVPTQFCIYSDEEIEETKAKCDRRILSEDEMEAQEAAREAEHAERPP
jgi:hypothetical protein